VHKIGSTVTRHVNAFVGNVRLSSSSYVNFKRQIPPRHSTVLGAALSTRPLPAQALRSGVPPEQVEFDIARLQRGMDRSATVDDAGIYSMCTMRMQAPPSILPTV
jgi:hypothetical protein